MASIYIKRNLSVFCLSVLCSLCTATFFGASQQNLADGILTPEGCLWGWVVCVSSGAWSAEVGCLVGGYGMWRRVPIGGAWWRVWAEPLVHVTLHTFPNKQHAEHQWVMSRALALNAIDFLGSTPPPNPDSRMGIAVLYHFLQTCKKIRQSAPTSLVVTLAWIDIKHLSYIFRRAKFQTPHYCWLGEKVYGKSCSVSILFATIAC